MSLKFSEAQKQEMRIKEATRRSLVGAMDGFKADLDDMNAMFTHNLLMDALFRDDQKTHAGGDFIREQAKLFVTIGEQAMRDTEELEPYAFAINHRHVARNIGAGIFGLVRDEHGPLLDTTVREGVRQIAREEKFPFRTYSRVDAARILRGVDLPSERLAEASPAHAFLEDFDDFTGELDWKDTRFDEALTNGIIRTTGDFLIEEAEAFKSAFGQFQHAYRNRADV